MAQNDKKFRDKRLKNDLDNDPKFRKLSQEIVGQIIISAYEHGEITDDELASPELIIEKVLRPVSKSDKFMITIDYRESILKDARDHRRRKEYHNALIFYALYFEHEINGLVKLIMERKGFCEDTINQPLRLPARDKLTWLADILGVKRPNKKFVKFMESSSENSFFGNRNSYVHYKWKGVDIDDDAKDKLIEQQLEEIEKQVRYLKRYGSSVIYNGRKKLTLKKVESFLAK